MLDTFSIDKDTNVIAAAPAFLDRRCGKYPTARLPPHLVSRLLEGDAEGAVPLLESALELRPGDRQSHYLLGLSYRALGRQEEAKRERLSFHAYA